MIDGRRDPLMGAIVSGITEMMAKRASVEGEFEGARVHTEGYTINVYYRDRHIEIMIRERIKLSANP